MENVIVKTAKHRRVLKIKSVKTGKVIPDEDIRRRAFEIYHEAGDNPHNELDDWFRAERELRGSD